jgi:uncharacterized protein
VQAELQNSHWFGRADVLLRVDTPSDLGNWSYEVADTKLARETRGGTILQLCLYTELVHELQGLSPSGCTSLRPAETSSPKPSGRRNTSRTTVT